MSAALHTPQPGLSAAEAFLATNFPSVDVSLGQLERELEHDLNDFMDQLFQDTVEEDPITGTRAILPLGGNAIGRGDGKGKGRLDDDGAIVRSSGLTIRSTCPAAIPSELAETAITDPGPSNAPTMTGKPARPRPRALAISTGSGGCGSLPATPPPAPTLAQAPPLLRLSTASPSEDSPTPSRPLTSSSSSLLQPPQRPNLLPVSASPAIPSTEASAFPDALFGPARPATPPPAPPITSAQPQNAFGAANAPQPVSELTSSSSFGQPAYTPSESAFGQASFAGASTLTPAISQQSTFGNAFGETRNTWAETPSACNEDVEMCDSEVAPTPGTWDNPMNPAWHPAPTPAFGIPTSASPSAWTPPPSVVCDSMIVDVEPALYSAQQSIFDLMTGPRASQAAGYVVPLANVPADVWEEEARRAHARQLASVQQQSQPPQSSIIASHARVDLWSSTRGRARERVRGGGRGRGKTTAEAIAKYDCRGSSIERPSSDWSSSPTASFISLPSASSISSAASSPTHSRSSSHSSALSSRRAPSIHSYVGYSPYHHYRRLSAALSFKQRLERLTNARRPKPKQRGLLEGALSWLRLASGHL